MPGRAAAATIAWRAALEELIRPAATLKISPHPQYHQSRRDLIRAVPGGGRRVQRWP